MVNNGSPVASMTVVNATERVIEIKEGEIKGYVENSEGMWVPQGEIPKLPIPPTVFSTNSIPLSISSAIHLPSIPALKVWIKSPKSNTGIIYIGDITVDVDRGYPLSAGEELVIEIDNLAKIYAIPTVDEEKLVFAYIQR